jgi:hypothetical protein
MINIDSTSASHPSGVLISAESISGDGGDQRYAEFVVTLDGDGTIDVRMGDRMDTIWMFKLGEVEEALRLLKRWRR